MIKLSIVIPAYNAEPYIYELIERLRPQVTDEVQVIIVDDGSKKPLKINETWIDFYSNDGNKGVSYTRNRGLELAKGKYIHFVDADDLLATNYVEYVLEKIKTIDFDYMDLSWKSLSRKGPQHNQKLNSDKDFLPNPSASTRIFSRSFIGNTRFNLNKDAAEDEDFTRHLGLKTAKRVCATEYMYFYRTETRNSLTKQYMSGIKNTLRVGFYYKHVTVDMTDLLDQIKECDKENEPILLTQKNDIPEIEKYATVYCPPRRVRVMEKHGEDCDYFELIKKPIRTQVVIYSSVINAFGGIETFIYSFCRRLEKYYDITVFYRDIDPTMLQKLENLVRCERQGGNHIVCDTLIMNKIADYIPENVTYKKSIQVLHAVYGTYDIKPKTDRDFYFAVSDVVNDSYKTIFPDVKTIRNVTFIEKTKDPLLLVSTTRLDTPEKGQTRMVKLANELKREQIPFLWIYFSNRDIAGPKEFIRMPQSEDISGWIRKADYLVQLSDTEGMSYSILEAMECGTKLIVTPLPMLKEIGFEAGIHGCVVPFKMDNLDLSKLKAHMHNRDYKYNHNNESIIKQWRAVLGNTTPKHDYKPSDAYKWIIVTSEYYDIALKQNLKTGEIRKMSNQRAETVINAGFGEIYKETKGE